MDLKIVRGALLFVIFFILVLALVFGALNRFAEVVTCFVAAVVVATVRLGVSIRISAREGDTRDDYLPATPGRWYVRYHDEWTAAHPGAFEAGTQESGHWRLGADGADVWCSSTLLWDQVWFRSVGMGMPLRRKYVDGRGPCKPNEVRIGTLGPGESVALQYDVAAGELKSLGVRGGGPPKGFRRWWVLPVALFAVVVTVGMLRAPHADADPAQVYADLYSYAVCGDLDANPTLDGVLAAGNDIHDAGFTYEDAGRIIAIAVIDVCPRHLPLLQRFIDTYVPVDEGGVFI